MTGATSIAFDAKGQRQASADVTSPSLLATAVDIGGGEAETGVATVFEQVAKDQLGFAREVTAARAGLHVNIVAFGHPVNNSFSSGGPLSQGAAMLVTPRNRSVDEVEDGLERLALDVMVELRLHADSKVVPAEKHFKVCAA